MKKFFTQNFLKLLPQELDFKALKEYTPDRVSLCMIGYIKYLTKMTALHVFM